jgi:hypothetical protein
MAVLLAAFGLGACAGEIEGGSAAVDGDIGDDVPSEALQPADDETGTISSELSVSVPIGSTLATTANLNLRSGPSTGYGVKLVIPSGARVTTVNRTTPSGGWYNIKYNGVIGWSYGSYLKLVTSGTTTTTPTASITDNTRAGAILRAKAGVGFSYWWGHARLLAGGPSSSTRGACYGGCPDCSHSGSYGADCSGYVAKIWEVPSSSNSSLSNDYHPYSTANFVADGSQWSTVSRGSVAKADAMVYRSGGAGHIFLYESGDGWGSMYAYEAKGCSYGIVHNLRTASSSYHAIRHY